MRDDTVMIEVPKRFESAIRERLAELVAAESTAGRERRTGSSVVDDGPESTPVQPSGPGTTERRVAE
jgi:hypothetical protein